MPSLIKTRTARTEDLPFLEGIIGQHWKINIDHQKELQNPQAILLVAEEENEEQSKRMIVGTALMWINDWNKTGYLGEIAVDKTMLRKRVGTQMIEQLAYRARENNLRSIIVETQLASAASTKVVCVSVVRPS